MEARVQPAYVTGELVYVAPIREKVFQYMYDPPPGTFYEEAQVRGTCYRDIIYPDRTGEIYLGKYSDAHQWYYYPAMEPGEVLVFKSYDSRLDMPARMTPHCPFDDTTAPADAPLRRSIEVRCRVVLD